MRIEFFIIITCVFIYLSATSNIRAEESEKLLVEKSVEFVKSKLSFKHKQDKTFSKKLDKKIEAKKSFANESNLVLVNQNMKIKDKKENNKKSLKNSENPWSVNFKSENIATNINKKIMTVELMYELRF